MSLEQWLVGTGMYSLCTQQCRRRPKSISNSASSNALSITSSESNGSPSSSCSCNASDTSSSINSASTGKSKSAGTLLRGGGRTKLEKNFETRPPTPRLDVCGDLNEDGGPAEGDKFEDEGGGMTRGGSIARAMLVFE